MTAVLLGTVPTEVEGQSGVVVETGVYGMVPVGRFGSWDGVEASYRPTWGLGLRLGTAPVTAVDATLALAVTVMPSGTTRIEDRTGAGGGREEYPGRHTVVSAWFGTELTEGLAAEAGVGFTHFRTTGGRDAGCGPEERVCLAGIRLFAGYSGWTLGLGVNRVVWDGGGRQVRLEAQDIISFPDEPGAPGLRQDLMVGLRIRW